MFPKRQDLTSYEGKEAVMILIFPHSSIQFLVSEHYKTLTTTKLGVSGWYLATQVEEEHPRIGTICCGVAGVITQTVFYAFDVNVGEGNWELFGRI
ncbi:hypothetical protein GH733_005774 [Mirounga leonina]|nr:hypothetical protein GH733_005774 [Mirounga leonina]